MLINWNVDGPVAIGVPVRDEVTRLPRLLAAFENQESPRAFTLCLFFDNCNDGSAQFVASRAPHLRYQIVTQSVNSGGPPNAGAARRKAMALALQHAQGGTLMTTDADSEPAVDWVAANCAALEHADIIAGRIARADVRAPDMHDRMAAYFDRLHALRRTLDPVSWEADGSHHWTSAASLACRSETYRTLGGFAAVANGEDAAFADGAARAGYRVRRDASVTVRTSSRRKGRAECGFAASLTALDASKYMPDVTHPEDEAWRFRMQARARVAFEAGRPHSVVSCLGLALDEVEQVALQCANGEAFAARIVGQPPEGMRTVGLGHAEALLAVLGLITMAGAA